MKPPDCQVVPIVDIRPDPENAAVHDAANDAAIRRLLELYGQYKPVIVDAGAHDPAKRGVIRAGNRLHHLMKEAGCERIWVHWKAFATELDAQVLAIGDNASAELGSWKAPVLAAQVTDLIEAGFAPADFAFHDFEVAPLTEAVWKDNPSSQKSMRVYKVLSVDAGPVNEAIETHRRRVERATVSDALVAICTRALEERA